MLHYLVYFSLSTRLMAQNDLTEILDRSRMYNNDHGITGMLVYVQGRFLDRIDGRFMQILEGTENEVEELFDRIAQDSRHYRVIVLQRGALVERYFVDWQMGFRSFDLNEDKVQGFFPLNDGSFLDEMPENPGAAIQFLRSFYQIHLDSDH